jgi:ribosomal protein S18 acetylase RimI-like enzyme
MTAVATTSVGGVSVRRAVRSDLEALLELEMGFPGDRMSRSSLVRLLGRDSADVWVAEEGGKVLGDAIVLFRRGFESARLYSMVVNPAYRGRGIARRLLEAAEEGARERGAILLRLEVREYNATAI